jgi:aspartate/methionine/tyrosine aminotransferase
VQIKPFRMERMQSVWENRVRYNLSESGVHPMELADLVDPSAVAACRLGYPPTNGSIELRSAIAALYPGAGPDNVVVTNGTAEANFVSIWNLVEPGTEFIVMVPNYMQIWGEADTFGAIVKPLPLQQVGGRWAPDLELLKDSMSPRTKLIAVCNPNNPTGGALTEQETRTICELAARHGSWILSDEVYQGAELSGQTTPTFWERYERLLVTNGLSKAYGLPGLRIGWVVAPAQKAAELWSYKDYTTLGPTALSDYLARVALGARSRILERTRSILRAQLPIVHRWLAQQPGIFTWIDPLAGAIVYLQYQFDVNSLVLFERLRDEKSVLVVPGDHFGMDKFLRVGFGGEVEILERGLDLVSELLTELGVAPAQTARS